METDELISIRDAAKIKGVCRQSIYHAIKAGLIKVALEIDGKQLLDRNGLDGYKPRKKGDAPEARRDTLRPKAKAKAKAKAAGEEGEEEGKG